jgi:uncharacterized membrane-anchored protein
MASTFLVRLRVGPILIDAKGVSRLYRGRVRRSDMFLLVGAAVLVLVISVLLSDVMRLELQLFWTEVQNWWFQLKESLFS